MKKGGSSPFFFTFIFTLAMMRMKRLRKVETPGPNSARWRGKFRPLAGPIF